MRQASQAHFKPADGAGYNAMRLYDHDLTAAQLLLKNWAKAGM